jgi:RNA polymerase sigma-70 factor, ECF subfamily
LMERVRGQDDGRTDAALLKAAAGGDVDAFGALYERHKEFVRRVARRYSGDDDVAMDVAQEVFLRLLGEVRRVRLVGKMTTYLYPVVKHAALARRRGEGRRAEILKDGVGPELERRRGEGEQGGRGEGDEREAELARALGALSEEHREVVLMRIVDEMTVEEVAMALGVPEGTVKSRLHHGLGRLREAWGK